MDKKFYQDIMKMGEEALQALAHYEKTSDLYKLEEVFNKIHAVGFACLDGEQINQSIINDLPVTDQYDFRRAVFFLARLNSLNRGGSGINPSISLKLNNIITLCQPLATTYANQESKTIFYSWQSSLPNNTNRGLIKDCLEKAIKEINGNLTIDSRIALDSDTSDTPGSPDIINTILNKINNAAVFVADVSIVNEAQPNSNVMFELGYAMKSLGDNKIVMVFNEAYGKAKELPFDLGFKRQMIYKYMGEEDKSKIKTDLTNKLKVAIKLIQTSSQVR